MATTIEVIKQLREETGAGVMACRAALEQSSASYTQALQLLREKAAAAAAKRAERTATNGLIEVYSHGNGRIAVMVEINTETDFAARSPLLRAFAHEIALQIAAGSPLYVHEDEIPSEVLEEQAAQTALEIRAEGKSEAILAKVIDGRKHKYVEETVLLHQVSIRDENVTIVQMLGHAAASVGENVVIRRFIRWELNDGVIG